MKKKAISVQQQNSQMYSLHIRRNQYTKLSSQRGYDLPRCVSRQPPHVCHFHPKQKANQFPFPETRTICASMIFKWSTPKKTLHYRTKRVCFRPASCQQFRQWQDLHAKLLTNFHQKDECSEPPFWTTRNERHQIIVYSFWNANHGHL